LNARQQLSAELTQKEESYREALQKPQFKSHFRGIELQKEKFELEQRKRLLEQEIDPNLTVEQRRERLLSQAKEDSAFVTDAEARSKQLEEEVESLHEQIRDKELQKDNVHVRFSKLRDLEHDD
jgi:flagellar motor protein MotB